MIRNNQVNSRKPIPCMFRRCFSCCDRNYLSRYHYNRAGVLLLDLCSKHSVEQELFTPDTSQPVHESLMNALDCINSRFGRNTLRETCWMQGAYTGGFETYSFLRLVLTGWDWLWGWRSLL